MEIPSIVVSSCEIEDILYFPADICGLKFGELYIPSAQIAQLNLPEMTVPDFAECPFAIVLPPPTFYASSTYPVFEVDSLSFSMNVLNVELSRDPIEHELSYNDSLELSLQFNGAFLRNSHVYMSTTESIQIGADVISGHLRASPMIRVAEEKITLSLDLLGIVSKSYRYLSRPLPPEDAIFMGMEVINAHLVGYRYLSNPGWKDSINLAMDFLGASMITYRFLTYQAYAPENIYLGLDLISGELKNV